MIRFCTPQKEEAEEGHQFDKCPIVFDKNIFEMSGAISGDNYLPICDNKGNVIFYAFDQQDFRYDQMESFLKVIKNRSSINLAKNIGDGFEAIYIHGLNGLSFELYNELHRRKQKVKVVGKEWEQIAVAEDVVYGYDIDDKIYHLYAENRNGYQTVQAEVSTIPSVGENFRGIINAGIKIGKEHLKNTLKQLCADVNVCFCHIPIDYPFFNTYSDNFCKIEEVHNKIQGYKPYRNEQEKHTVDDIYGICLQAQVNKHKNVVFSDGSFVTGMSSLKERKQKRIFVIGPCIVSGYCVSDEYIFAKLLQNKVYDSGYEVVRISISKINWIVMDFLLKLPIRDKDIFLFVSETDSFPAKSDNRITNLYLRDCYLEMDAALPWFSDVPSHVNKQGHQRIAEYIYENYLKDKIKELEKREGKYVQVGEKDPFIEQEISKFVNTYKVKNKGVVGSIVMNCNPFTKGHRYLIEKALDHVDVMYIFVVQEDKSFFPFEQRMAMVKLGCKDLENVIVIPSGKFVLSAMTLKSYFEKEEKQDIEVDASIDIEIFGKYIAPAFGIKYRYGGAEPIDKVTRQYNEQMAKLLPQMGVTFVEVERKMSDGEYISASRVRKAIKDGRVDDIKDLVPKSTFEYIRGLRL